MSGRDFKGDEAELDLFDLSLTEMMGLFAAWGEPAYRARQLWHWLYGRLEVDFAAMSDLPAGLRDRLSRQAHVGRLAAAATEQSLDGETTKYLFRLPDGRFIETVLMRYERRRTVCISTQAGCGMGCVFCATGQMGLQRQLTAGEIVDQVITIARMLATEGDRLTNVVFMGMGEPFHNYDQTMAALDRLTDADGFNLGARRLTISTVGLVPAIYRYADERRQTPLAVSLHAATDEERDRLIPINRRWPLSELMAACRYYVAQTSRRLTIEWALIEGVNDTMDQATRLGELVSGLLCHVNLIPLNPTHAYGGRPSTATRVTAFQGELARHGVSSTVRVRRGIDIQAGCGQLRERVVSEDAGGPAADQASSG